MLGIIGVLLLACTAVVTYFATRSRMERARAQQAQDLANALAALQNERRVFDETAKAIEERTRRAAMEELLGEVRIEERRYVREHRVLFAHRKSLVLQERIFFRNVPLSNWVEHEVPIEEGADLDDVAKTLSVFNALEAGASLGREGRRLLS
jgi:multidrug efflux pump subunit AcrA (membrane-fusion protein)